MNIIIVEDEALTAADLASTILKVEPSVRITAVLKSVKEAVTYFSNSPLPDLVFSDIQLGDGVCFEIFCRINCTFPVIFCTAYDEYALDAFKSNGIDYILKPFSEASVAATLKKYHALKEAFSDDKSFYSNVLSLLESVKDNRKSSVLVYFKDKILPVRLDHIALFYIDNEITYLRTFDNERYSVNKPLEELERLAGNCFYRINRQLLVNRDAIKEASHSFSRKLSVTLTVPFNEKILVRKEKVREFLDWLSGNR